MECSGRLDNYLHAYQDSVGVWTVGVGSTVMLTGRRVARGDAVTHADALALLEKQIDAWGVVIAHTITATLSDPWMAVLVSFVHQMGTGNLPSSVLADMINGGLLARAGRQLNGWVMAGGKPALGIMRRQEAQRRMTEGTSLMQAVNDVWKLGSAPLLVLYQAACSDAARYRGGHVTWTVHPVALPVAVHPAASTPSEADALDLKFNPETT